MGGCSKETEHKSENSCACVGLDPKDQQTNSFVLGSLCLHQSEYCVRSTENVHRCTECVCSAYTSRHNHFYTWSSGEMDISQLFRTRNSSLVLASADTFSLPHFQGS